MKIEKIRPIPKYMLEKIKKLDKKRCPNQDGSLRFYAYFTKNDKELVKVTVAVKCYKKKWYYKQVAVHGIHSEKCFVKDMVFSSLGGYSVGWYLEGIHNTYRKWFEDGEWGWSLDKYFDPYALIVNIKYIIPHFPEYKYSAVEQTQKYEIFKYLRLYEQYPILEYITKFGMHNIAFSKQILKLATKNKYFRGFLVYHQSLIANNYFYVEAIIKAFRQKKPIEEVDAFLTEKNKLIHDKYKSDIKEEFIEDLPKFFNYIKNQKTSIASYQDYLTACKRLGIDMKEDKNRYPHEFKRWHDIRIDQYASLKAKEEATKKKEMEQKFGEIVAKYLGLEYSKQDVFITKIAHAPSDLVYEGEILKHCVGSMGYDQKMMRGETLIFFVRTKEEPEKPLVTVEYSPSKKKILQCYGINDTKPSDDILNYVNNQWLPYANRKVKKLVA